jgi:hypothetical protein
MVALPLREENEASAKLPRYLLYSFFTDSKEIPESLSD